MRAAIALIMLLSLVTLSPAAEMPSATVKQLDLAKKIIDIFGWSEGLPDNPLDKDYLAILGGNRTFRFEAEDIFDRQSDAVSVRDTPLFGAFSGSSWLNGTSSSTAVHFRIFMPVSGKYTLHVSASGNEQLWSIAGRAFKASFGDKLQERRIGEVFIPSGYLDFNTLIPPSAGLDYLLFTAPALTAIAPADGWNFSMPLTTGALAETASALLGNELLLPDDPSFTRQTVAASTAVIPDDAQLTDVQIYGKSVSVRWVRATHSPSTIFIPITIEKDGVYRLRARCMGTGITAGFGTTSVTSPAVSRLEWIDSDVPPTKGNRSVELHLPPASGVDSIEISRKLSTPADYIAINKLPGKAGDPVSPAQLDAVIKSLHDQFKERK